MTTPEHMARIMAEKRREYRDALENGGVAINPDKPWDITWTPRRERDNAG